MNQTEIGLELLRAAVLDCNPDIPLNTLIDWDKLMYLSAEQGVLAWVWDGICKLPKEQQPPRRDRINWSLSALEITNRYTIQKQVLDQMVQMCQQNNIKLLLLKGIGLSKLYPNPSSRPSGDLDVFFCGEYEKGNQLFAQTGVAVSKKHSSFNYCGVHVENHITFLNQDWRKRRRIEKYIQSNIDNAILTSDGYYILEPDSNILFLTMHATRHLRYTGSFGLTLRSIVDVSMFLIHYRSDLPPYRCFQLMDQFGVAHCFELIIYLGECALGIDFSSYRRNLLPKSDMEASYKMFIENDYLKTIPSNVSYIQNRRLNRIQFRQCKWKFHYEPYYTLPNMLFELKIRFRTFCIYLFNLPRTGSFRQNMNKKFKKM